MSQPTTPTPAPTPVRLLRPAIIEIRFRSRPKYDSQVKLYSKLLKLPTPSTSSIPDSVIMPLGFAAVGDSSQTLRLLLLKGNGNRQGMGRTITYWEVEGSGTPHAEDSIQKASNALVQSGNGFQVVEALPSQKEGSQVLASKEVQTLLKDSDGNFVGLVINPPYPSFTKKKHPSHEARTTEPPRQTESSPSTGSSKVLLIGLGVLIGLLIGWVIAKLMQQTRR
jgi:hypothetical protein